MQIETRGSRLLTGVWAGLIGGVIFGILIGPFHALIGAPGSILPTVAGLVGSQSALVGFAVNLVVSIITALIFVVLLGRFAASWKSGLSYGLGYGVAWWFLGPFIIMPVWLTGSLGSISFGAEAFAAKLPSLWAHLVFGAVVGAAYALLAHRGSGSQAQAGEFRQREEPSPAPETPGQFSSGEEAQR